MQLTKWVDYTEVRTDIAIEGDEESSPSSFARDCDERVKSRFPCSRSYIFRRRLACAALTSIFIVAGVLASFYTNIFELSKFMMRATPLSADMFVVYGLWRNGEKYNKIYDALTR